MFILVDFSLEMSILLILRIDMNLNQISHYYSTY